MFTDIVTQKGEAKKDIQGALLGLLIVLSAVLILTIINPELTRFNLGQERVGLPAEQQTNQERGELSELAQAIEEGARGRNCEIIGCEAESVLCEDGGFFESDPNRIGTARVVTRGNINALFCTPIETEVEILARLNQERLVTTSNICNENSLYTWDTSTNRCMEYTQGLEIVTLTDILDFSSTNPGYQRVQALLAEEYGRDYIEDNLQDFIQGAIPISFDICSTIDGGQGTFTSINNTSCQSSTQTQSQTEAPPGYQFTPVTDVF